MIETAGINQFNCNKERFEDFVTLHNENDTAEPAIDFIFSKSRVMVDDFVKNKFKDINQYQDILNVVGEMAQTKMDISKALYSNESTSCEGHYWKFSRMVDHSFKFITNNIMIELAKELSSEIYDYDINNEMDLKVIEMHHIDFFKFIDYVERTQFNGMKEAILNMFISLYNSHDDVEHEDYLEHL